MLVDKGFPVSDMKFFPCSKIFRYGNDSTGESTARAVVPSFPGGRFVEILTHVIPGHTPFLIARPITEELGLVTDYKKESVLAGMVTESGFLHARRHRKDRA